MPVLSRATPLINLERVNRPVGITKSGQVLHDAVLAGRRPRRTASRVPGSAGPAAAKRGIKDLLNSAASWNIASSTEERNTYNLHLLQIRINIALPREPRTRRLPQAWVRRPARNIGRDAPTRKEPDINRVLGRLRGEEAIVDGVKAGPVGRRRSVRDAAVGVGGLAWSGVVAVAYA